MLDDNDDDDDDERQKLYLGSRPSAFISNLNLECKQESNNIF